MMSVDESVSDAEMAVQVSEGDPVRLVKEHAVIVSDAHPSMQMRGEDQEEVEEGVGMKEREERERFPEDAAKMEE